MKRRDFVNNAGCRFAALMAAPLAAEAAFSGPSASQIPPSPPPSPRAPYYKLEIEIFEARPDTWCHKKGDRFAYPQDIGALCPWLLSSLHDFLIVLEKGATLPWKYEKTPYAKVIDPAGVTTEYVRCPDPTSNLVAKIIRTKIG
jgi:uncharacterized repeat protein (TIGR04076 family)